MARKAMIEKSKKNPKYSTRKVRRCWRCGRINGYMRDFELCRICFRELAENGDLPGVKRASW
jgi:small subunit ribosomal protein S14